MFIPAFIKIAKEKKTICKITGMKIEVETVRTKID